MYNQEVNPVPKKKPIFFYGYIIVAASFIIQTVMFGLRSTFGVFFKPLIAEFGWTRALLSGAYSVSTFLQGFIGIVMGNLNDRLGPRVVMTLCGFLVGLGYMLMALTNHAWQLYLFYVVIVGIGMGGIYTPPMSTITRWFIHRRSIMTGIALAGGGTGGLILPPILNWIISVYGWRSSYIIIGILLLITVIMAAQFLKRDPAKMGLTPYGKSEVETPEVNIAVEGFSFKEAIFTRQFWMTIAMIFCFGFCISVLMVHVVPHVTDLGISSATAANILAAMGGGILIGGIVLGSVADKMGNRQTYTVCFVLMVVALLLLLSSTDQVWMFYVSAAILGLGGGGSAAITSPLVAELFGIRSHGFILGIIATGQTMGVAVGPFVAGYIFDVRNSYQPAFLITAIVGVAGLILSTILRPVRISLNASLT